MRSRSISQRTMIPSQNLKSEIRLSRSVSFGTFKRRGLGSWIERAKPSSSSMRDDFAGVVGKREDDRASGKLRTPPSHEEEDSFVDILILQNHIPAGQRDLLWLSKMPCQLGQVAQHQPNSRAPDLCTSPFSQVSLHAHGRLGSAPSVKTPFTYHRRLLRPGVHVLAIWKNFRGGLAHQLGSSSIVAYSRPSRMSPSSGTPLPCRQGFCPTMSTHPDR